MARGKGSSTGLNDPFWVGSCTLCGFYFWLSMSNVIIHVLREKERVWGRGGCIGFQIWGYFPCVDFHIHGLKCLAVAQMEIPVPHPNSDIQD